MEDNSTAATVTGLSLKPQNSFKYKRKYDVTKGMSSALTNSGALLLVFCSDRVLLNIVQISTKYFIL